MDNLGGLDGLVFIKKGSSRTLFLEKKNVYSIKRIWLTFIDNFSTIKYYLLVCSTEKFK